MPFSVIAAVGMNGEIGLTREGVPGMPWPKILGDLRFFQAVTTAVDPYKMAYHFCTFPQTVSIADGTHNPILWHTEGNVVICGHRTYNTLPHPLPARKVIVLRDQTAHGAGDWPCKARTFTEALEKAQALQAPNIFAIGGTRVFAAALQHPACQTVFLTEVDWTQEVDTYFPTIYACAWNEGRMCFHWPGTQCLEGWVRNHVSSWIQDPATGLQYRFGIWERV